MSVVPIRTPFSLHPALIAFTPRIQSTTVHHLDKSSMPSVLTVVNLLLSHAQAKSKLPESQSGNQASTSDVMMLAYMRERARPSTVPILDPNGTPIWLTRLIGQGGQARVFVGERRGVCYAVKSFNRQQVIDEGNAKHVRRELGILSHLTEDLSHPFIIQLEWAFGYNRNLFLVMVCLMDFGDPSLMADRDLIIRTGAQKTYTHGWLVIGCTGPKGSYMWRN